MVIALLLYVCINVLPVSIIKLSELRPGMDKTEVQTVIGIPSNQYQQTWTYSHSLLWPIVYIRFDANQQFMHYEIDR